ncbi:MAG: hypothetical protein ACLFVC_04965, partial [Opitutales bacterium]
MLLDTLCNTMGSVIFIAILMLIIVQRTPMGTLDVPPVSEEQMAFLRATPSTTESSLQLSSLKQQIEDYEARGITPVPTEVPLEALLAERAELSAAYKRLSHTKPDRNEEPAVSKETEETEVETKEPASPAFAFPAV